MGWQSFLMRVNDVLTAGVAATAFALTLYLFFYNRNSRVARAFSGLLACVIVVYIVDLLSPNDTDAGPVWTLLRLQWLGIAFTPPFYIEFVRSIRLSVMKDRFPGWLRWVIFLTSSLVTALALWTDLVVRDGVASTGALHLQPGPLFYPFAVVFAGVALWGLSETLAARRRCYTRTARRRMTYLLIGFVAPAMGVFPYLLLIGWPARLTETLFWCLLIIGNIGVACMLVLMAYSVAFIGALTPARAIKHRMVRFLLRGPLTAIVALAMFGLGLTLEPALGMRPYTLSLMVLAASVIVMQLGIELAKPLIDLALYREGQAEVTRIQELSQRLLTTADLWQFLENVLAAMCEVMHSNGGFLAMMDHDTLHWDVRCNLHISPEDLLNIPFEKVMQAPQQDQLIFWDGYWVLVIRDRKGDDMLGLVGLRSPEVTLPLLPAQEALVDELLAQAGAALEDRRWQQIVFGTFSPLFSELTDIQRRGSMLRYEGEAVTGFPLLTESPELPQWVHDALAHYWGGPRLTENPLLDLEVVKRAAANYDGNVVKGLRVVLADAVEHLRPDGERKLTAPEWLLYNILEMKFLRGHKVHEVATRLAVSESDLYRKQRIAIENLAEIIASMEKEVCNNGQGALPNTMNHGHSHS
ncbi:MAG TPA: histidine kinase N-terminal 7TM domain-containing protein [Anaerolineae bacterium]|nr:histidine kinase N-terminal 7TM domain-containing protein [Anaerolineae bacterium]HQH38750.1 histidine kinase N-terminal 7TM domain-containing protein [Anaerolineae bacterium]